MQTWQETILSQYDSSPTLLQLVQNMNTNIDPSINIDIWHDLVWNVDTAIGYGLDVWGRIVGVGRVLQVATGSYFGFLGPTSGPNNQLPNTPTYANSMFNQSIFYNNEPLASLFNNFSLLDPEYRILILAKALFNICNGTIPAINQILINVFGANGLSPVPGNSYCTDDGNMKMSYTFSSLLTPLQLAVIQQSGVFPKPCGVTLSINQL